VEIKGGRQAQEFEKWMASWDDPNMYKISHGCYGATPGAKLTGNMLEDERMFGSVEFGFGYQPDEWGGWGGQGNPSKSHTDGVCLNASVWLDGEQIEDKGEYIHP
jgi:2,5-dihydroxypyridine 5,6-dioxygenase